MPLNISTITNPHTEGRGSAILFKPHDTSRLSVRYDEYDLSPAFFVSMMSEDVEVVSLEEFDDGCSIRINTRDGEVTLILGCSLSKFSNSFDAALDEWAES